MAEPAREILAEQRSIDGAGTPDRDPSVFVDLLLQRSIRNHQTTRHGQGPTLFDRGIPDCIAYAVVLGVDRAPSMLASETYRYHGEVLILPPWEEIYATDGERTMSFSDTVGFHEAILDAYEQAGYELIQVPRTRVPDRAAFVRDHIIDRGRRYARAMPPRG